MANPLSSPSQPQLLNDPTIGQQLHRATGIVSAWGPLALLGVALAYASAGLLLHPGSLGFSLLFRSAIRPLTLFAIGLVPMLGAALVIWVSRHSLSPAERRSRLLGAAMSAALFLPALLLARLFG